MRGDGRFGVEWWWGRWEVGKLPKVGGVKGRWGGMNVWLGFWTKIFWLIFRLGEGTPVQEQEHHDEYRLVSPRGKHV